LGDNRDRVAVALEAAARFAQGRQEDELSLVAFAGEAVTRVPPSSDPEVILAGVASLNVDFVRNGTNISEAILTAIAQLMRSERETRVLILLTDGAHNQAGVTPFAAARVASALGIRVHSISIGAQDEQRVVPGGGIDLEVETALVGISSLTGGRYFRATSASDLEAIYLEIDRIEASIEAPVTRVELDPWRAWFLGAALALLAMEIVLRGSRWEVIP
jgi:Ca-activated chloride channel homolog